MKLLTNLRNRLRANLANNERGQGATEYILLLTVVVALVVMFGPTIKTKFKEKMGTLTTDMDRATADQ
jgi:Flp pilus assembly pilin Flp